MRTRCQTPNTRRRKATSPPQSPISELSQDWEPIQLDDGISNIEGEDRSNEKADAPNRHAGLPESHSRQTVMSGGVAIQAIDELDEESAVLPQLSLSPPPARQTVFLPSPEQDQPCSPPADPQAEAEVNRRFEEERRLGEAHFAALGLVAGGSQTVEVDSVLGGDEEDVPARELGSSHQYHTRHQQRTTKAEAEAAEILMNLRKASVGLITNSRKTRGPNKKKSSAQKTTARGKQKADSKAKASSRKNAVSTKAIISSSSSDNQTDRAVANIDVRPPQVRFAEQVDIRHFDPQNPMDVASTSSCIDTPSFSQSGPTANDSMIVRPQSPVKIHMERVAVNTSANAGAVLAGSPAAGPSIFRTSFDFPVHISNATGQVLPRTQEAPREPIAKLSNWLIESVTERPAYIIAQYRALIAKGDLGTARKLLELVHSVQRRNVVNMPPMPRPLSFAPHLESDRRRNIGPPVVPPRQTNGGESWTRPTGLLMGDTGASNGSRERPVEDLRYLRREVSPDTP